MMRSIALPSSSSVLFDSIDLPRLHSSSSRSATNICYSSLRSHAYIPKLEPFSRRSKIDRGMKEPSLIEKSENEISEYCSVLEGDDSFDCWQAYFELKDLERKLSKDDVEKLIHQTEGVKSLIGIVHGVSAIHKRRDAEIEEEEKEAAAAAAALKALDGEKEVKKQHFPVPDGLPKTNEEIEEEEDGRMPDSPFTRLLRNKGKFPAWFSPTPDHETD